jgi:signal transduction histidine kinase
VPRAGLFERIEEWSWRLYRLEPERLRRETNLRVALLRRLLVATAAAGLLYAALEMAGVLANRVFPYDLIELFLVLAICRWLLARGNAATATVLFLAVISHPAAFAAAQYGIDTPVPGLLIPSLLVCGLLVGGYFLSTWTAVCCLLLVWIAYRTGTLADAATVRALAFWWVLFVAVGWLVHLFSGHLERRWQVEHRQASALGRLLAVLAAGQPLEDLLARLAALLREEFDADGVCLCRHDAATDSLTIVAASRKLEPAADAPTSIPANDLAAWRGVVAGRDVLQVPNPCADNRVSGWPALFSARSEHLLLAPVFVGPEPGGLLAIDFARPPRDPQEETDLARVLARELALFFQVEQLARSQRQAAVLEERNRMARDIHDSLAQGFTGIVVQLNAAEEMLHRQPDAARRHLDAARTLARSSLDEARRSVHALRPQALEHGGLSAALARIVGELTAGRQTEIDFRVSGQARPLAPDVELNVLRVGQEALTNAVRHSRCDRIVIALDFESDGLRLEVCDNGSGAVPPSCEPADGRGNGLPGMEERARRVGGTLRVEGSPGIGTKVCLTVPSG